MKGKQQIVKLFKPSIVFFCGIVLIISIFVYFISLYFAAMENLENLFTKIDNINHIIFENLAGDELDPELLSELVIQLDSFLKDDALILLVNAYGGSDVENFKIEITNRTDLYNIYTHMSYINEILDSFNVKRKNTFRVLHILTTVILVLMIFFLGISPFENYKINRQKHSRNRINNKLYDQLEKERSLIAFELHDDIAQKLAIIKRYFSNKNSIDEHTILMEKYSSEVIKRVRYLSRMLKAPDNPDVPFKDYLETMFSDFNVLSEYKLNRKIVGLNAIKLQPPAALHIYRIIQEILTNSRIHSQATEIDLIIVYSHPSLNITYSDNGRGFDPYLVYRKGIGLDSIKYRLEILQGEYSLHSNEGEGTDITIDIPIELCEIF